MRALAGFLLLFGVAMPSFAVGEPTRLPLTEALDGVSALFGEEPTHAGVERLLIEGFTKYRDYTPLFENDRMSWDGYIVEDLEIEKFFSDYYLKRGADEWRLDSPWFYEEYPHQLRDASLTRLAKGDDRDKQFVMTRVFESLIWLHDRFDENLAALVQREPILRTARTTALAIIESALDPPKLTDLPRKLSQRELEDLATQHARALFVTTYGFDIRNEPKSQSTYMKLGLMELESSVSKLANQISEWTKMPLERARIRAERVFMQQYGVNPSRPSSNYLLTRGERSYTRLEEIYHDLWDKELLAAELLNNRRPRPPDPQHANDGDSVRIDYIAQVVALKEQLLKHFRDSLDPNHWQIYERLNHRTFPGAEEQYRLAYDPARESIAHLNWTTHRSWGWSHPSIADPSRPNTELVPFYFPEDRLRDSLLRGQVRRANLEGHALTKENTVSAHFRKKLEERSVIGALRKPGSDIFLDTSPPRFQDFVFQDLHLRAQAFGTLYVLLDDLEFKLSSFEAAKHRPFARLPPNIADQERTSRELREMPSEFAKFEERTYDNWFKPLFNRHYAEYTRRVGFSRFELLRLLAVWLTRNAPDYLSARDQSAGLTDLSLIAAPFKNAVERYASKKEFWERESYRVKYEPKADSTAVSARAAPVKLRTDAPLAEPSGNEKAPLQYEPLTHALSGDEDGIVRADTFHVPADRLSFISAPIVVHVASWSVSPVTVFGPQKLQDLEPVTFAKSSLNLFSRRRVMVLKGQPVLESKILPLLSPIGSVLTGLQVYDENGSFIPPTAYVLLKSGWDQGYAIRFTSPKTPKNVRYRAYYKADHDVSELAALPLTPEERNVVDIRLRSARANVVADRIKDKPSLSPLSLAQVFAKSSYYVDSTAEPIAIGGHEPHHYSKLVTKDHYFVGNCLPSHTFLESVIEPVLAGRKIFVQVRTVLLMNGRRYREGEPLHAVLFMRNEAGKSSWVDATPHHGPLKQVARPDTFTIGGLVLRSLFGPLGRALLDDLKDAAQDSVNTFIARLSSPFRGEAPLTQNSDKVNSEIAELEGENAKASEPDKGTSKAAPYAPTERVEAGNSESTKSQRPAEQQPTDPVFIDPIQRAWDAQISPESDMYRGLKSALTTLAAERATIMNKMREAGIEKVDRSHPAWTALEFASVIISYANGTKSFDELTQDFSRLWNIPLDRREQTPLSYLLALRQKLEWGLRIAERAKRESRGKRPEDRNLILLSESLATQSLTLTLTPGMEYWHRLKGILDDGLGCVGILNPGAASNSIHSPSVRNNQ